MKNLIEQMKKDEKMSEQNRQLEIKALKDQREAEKIEAKKLEEGLEKEKKQLEKELQEKSEFQDLLEQVKPWRFVEVIFSRRQKIILMFNLKELGLKHWLIQKA